MYSNLHIHCPPPLNPWKCISIKNLFLKQLFTEWPAVLLHDVEVDLEDVDARGVVQDGTAHHHRGHHDPQELESRGE